MHRAHPRLYLLRTEGNLPLVRSWPNSSVTAIRRARKPSGDKLPSMPMEHPRANLTHLRHWLCTAPIVSVPIKVPVSADAMLSSELGNRYAATRVHHAGRRHRGGLALAAHAQQPARSHKVGL